MNKLIYLIGVLIFVVYINCEPPQDIDKMVDQCLSELEITEKPTSLPDLEKESKKGCFLACMAKKLGRLENGKVNLEKEWEILLKEVPKADDTVKALLAECVDLANRESDECETAAVIMKCYSEKFKGKFYKE